MTLPMVAWMTWRGHGWRPCSEMAAAMLAPALAVVVLLETALLEGVATAMTAEHVAMFGAMAARPEEYSHPASPRRRELA